MVWQALDATARHWAWSWMWACDGLDTKRSKVVLFAGLPVFNPTADAVMLTSF